MRTERNTDPRREFRTNVDASVRDTGENVVCDSAVGSFDDGAPTAIIARLYTLAGQFKPSSSRKDGRE